VFIDVSLRQREWDRADGQKQNYVKRASKKMCLGSGIFLFFHFCFAFFAGFKISSDRNDFPSWNARFSQAHAWVSRIFSLFFDFSHASLSTSEPRWSEITKVECRISKGWPAFAKATAPAEEIGMTRRVWSSARRQRCSDCGQALMRSGIL
jgi:hypothetical protein